MSAPIARWLQLAFLPIMRATTAICAAGADSSRNILNIMASKTIEAKGSGTRALRRVAHRLVRRASRTLASPALSDTAVHGARKDLKRCRTALRLLRPALGEPVYCRENAVLRDAAHALNAARDAKMLTQTLQSLRQSNRALRRDAGVGELLRMLRAEQAAVRRRLREHPLQLARTHDALEQLCDRMNQWSVGRHGWSVVGPALKRIYRSGRRSLPATPPFPADRPLHEWRKQVKYLRYALEILTPMRTPKLAALARQAKQLTDCLGEAHDLAVLTQKARGFARRNSSPLRPLFTIICRRRKQLTLNALTSGEQVYRARPRDWERPLSRYWQEWRRAA
jgi:CHAD domain-containing protein